MRENLIWGKIERVQPFMQATTLGAPFVAPPPAWILPRDFGLQRTPDHAYSTPTRAAGLTWATVVGASTFVVAACLHFRRKLIMFAALESAPEHQSIDTFAG